MSRVNYLWRTSSVHGAWGGRLVQRGEVDASFGIEPLAKPSQRENAKVHTAHEIEGASARSQTTAQRPMTAAEPARRSTRIRDSSSSQLVDYDDHIDGEDFEEEGAWESDAKATNRKRKVKGTVESRKKAKTVSRADYVELREEFEDHYIFQAIVDPEVSVAELANDWVDLYKTNKDLAKKDLINFILNAVGCFTKIEEHDVANNESASETVGEIQTFFKRQKVHEFYLLSKKPEYKHLLKNYTQFVAEIIEVCDEKGLLYDNIAIAEDGEEVDEPDETNVIEDLLIWLSSFSVSSVRSLRYISTMSLFTIETTLCKTVEKNNTSLEKFKHQLGVEEAKKQTAAVKKRVEQISRNIATYTNQSIILENLVQDIVNTTFIHRFKDVDYRIRAEAMIALGEWMQLYPELFYKVTYLKYLGWVLSDANSSVRLQVVKTLGKLLKQNVVVSGLRQFLERFKTRILEMAFFDVDINVKINSISLLADINRVGFLEEEEITKLTSLVFNTEEKKVQQLAAMFIAKVEAERTTDLIETHAAMLDMEQESFPQSLNTLVKLKTLICLLKDAWANTESPSTTVTRDEIFTNVGKLLASTKSYSNLWHELIDYYTLDSATVDDLDESVLPVVKLEPAERPILLSLICGFLIEWKAGKITDDDSLDLISKLPSLMKASELSPTEFTTCLSIFGLLPVEFFDQHNEAELYVNTFKLIARYLKNNIIGSSQQGFIGLLKSLPSSGESAIISDVRLVFEHLIKELIRELMTLLKDPSFNITNDAVTQLHDDFILKLLVLGTSFDISPSLDVFEPLKDSLLVQLTELDLEDKGQQSRVVSFFKLLLSAVSWELNNLLQSDDTYDADADLRLFPEILQEQCVIIEQKSYALRFRSDVALGLVDFYTILKNFVDEYKQSAKNNISHLERFIELSLQGLEPSIETRASLKDIFLLKEVQYASLSQVMLEREDDEDIGYNSIKAKSDDDPWDLERDLVVYAAKLQQLIKLGLLPRSFANRLVLNRDAMGELFQSVIQVEGIATQDDDDDDVQLIPLE